MKGSGEDVLLRRCDLDRTSPSAALHRSLTDAWHYYLQTRSIILNCCPGKVKKKKKKAPSHRRAHHATLAKKKDGYPARALVLGCRGGAGRRCVTSGVKDLASNKRLFKVRAAKALCPSFILFPIDQIHFSAES